MSTKTDEQWLYDLLENFDKTCPKCHDEGHGGDGCEYCWNNNTSKMAIDKAKQEILSRFKSQQLSLIERFNKEVIGEDEPCREPDDPWFDHDDRVADSKNELRYEQREKTAALRKELQMDNDQSEATNDTAPVGI